MLLDEILARPEGAKRRVALVKAEHDESLLTVKQALAEEIADFVLIGNADAIREKCEVLDVPLSNCEILDISDDQEAAEKGAALAAEGSVDVLMKGIIHSSVFTRALLNKELGLVPPGGLISHFGIFELPGLPGALGITDSALNIAPDLEQKKIILENALNMMHRLTPRLLQTACIAPVEKVNPKIPATVDAAALAAMEWEGAHVEGPLALDVALSAEAADLKGIESDVAGQPDLLLFPDLNSANAVYKAFAFMPGSRHAGVLAGLSLPVILTSRSDPEEVRSLSLKLAIAASGVTEL
ncbi:MULTISPECIES: phosphate acyltransferase [unclassified Oceanispirochaeta]|uniref:phosphate acyltransferase n=1 Tax=unclassified Oceanispirochaeta TaxID=2635722 RepID=UPI000E097DF1|nr:MULTISPECIES: phosphate acyltransferase [unclassified Oceanispirochaeta]MBF9016604.1 phosphate butyryltransferase [Oceanispirochaeta sp. M2]NPD73067.1 phosphate butyryltransferase [Oceanispirochaeta sp. M1]RDG31412.1 phosphate butyryltransferase [Oceanispirochaeta sp. M1]